MIFPEIQKKNYSGKIEVVLKGRLEGSVDFFNSLKAQIIQVIDGLKSDEIKREYQISLGKILFDLIPSNGKPIDIDSYYANLLQRKPENAHVVLLTERLNNQYINPVEVIMSSEKQEDVVEAIQEAISAAGTDQLYCDKPGLIVCFLEGIEGHDLENLKTNSNLQRMTLCQLDKPEFSHVMAVSYTAEQRSIKFRNAETFDYPHLLFRNPKCKFEDAKKYELYS